MTDATVSRGPNLKSFELIAGTVLTGGALPAEPSLKPCLESYRDSTT